MSIADLQLRMQQARTRFTRRNVLLYGYGGFNIVFGLFAATSERLQEYRVLLMVAAHLFVLWQVWKRFTPRDIALRASGQTALQFHRSEIERQHGAVNQAWLWYIAPFMPAFVWELSIWFGRIQTSAPDASGLPLFAMVVVARAVSGAASGWPSRDMPHDWNWSSSVWQVSGRSSAQSTRSVAAAGDPMAN